MTTGNRGAVGRSGSGETLAACEDLQKLTLSPAPQPLVALLADIIS